MLFPRPLFRPTVGLVTPFIAKSPTGVFVQHYSNAAASSAADSELSGGFTTQGGAMLHATPFLAAPGRVVPQLVQPAPANGGFTMQGSGASRNYRAAGSKKHPRAGTHISFPI
jgi:hypothetical protein